MKNKIGIAISRTMGGMKVPIEINEGDWVNMISDIRHDLAIFSNLPQDKVVQFFSFTDNGILITFAKYISGRGADNLAAWVFIPNTINVDEELLEDLNKIKNLIEISDIDQEKLEEIGRKERISQEYPVKFKRSSKEDYYAVRKEPLKELLGADIYYPYYGKYNKIFILEDNNLAIPSEVDDITEKEMWESITVTPPAKEDINKLGENVNIVDEEKNSFDKPIKVKKGTKVIYIAKKNGFEDIKLTYQANDDGKSFAITNKEDWKKKISKNAFKITVSGQERDLNDLEILINGQPFSEEAFIKEKDCKEVKIKISQKEQDYLREFEEFERVYNLIENSIIKAELKQRPISISRDKVKLKINNREEDLSKKTKIQINRYELTEGKVFYFDKEKDIENISLIKNKEKIEHSSWNYSNGELTIELPSKNEKPRWYKSNIALVFFCFVLGVAIGAGGWWLWKYLRKNPTIETEAKVMDAEDNKNSSDNKDKIEELFKSGILKKEEMEKIPELNGLFDELNRYEFNNVLKRDIKLSGFSELKSIIDSLNTKRVKLDDIYDKDEKEINIKKYIEKIREKSRSISQDALPSSNAPSDENSRGNNQQQPRNQSKTPLNPKNNNKENKTLKQDISSSPQANESKEKKVNQENNTENKTSSGTSSTGR